MVEINELNRNIVSIWKSNTSVIPNMSSKITFRIDQPTSDNSEPLLLINFGHLAQESSEKTSSIVTMNVDKVKELRETLTQIRQSIEKQA